MDSYRFFFNIQNYSFLSKLILLSAKTIPTYPHLTPWWLQSLLAFSSKRDLIKLPNTGLYYFHAPKYRMAPADPSYWAKIPLEFQVCHILDPPFIPDLNSCHHKLPFIPNFHWVATTTRPQICAMLITTLYTLFLISENSYFPLYKIYAFFKA